MKLPLPKITIITTTIKFMRARRARVTSGGREVRRHVALAVPEGAAEAVDPLGQGVRRGAWAGSLGPLSRTRNLEFQGFDSVRFLILRGGIPRSIGDFPARGSPSRDPSGGSPRLRFSRLSASRSSSRTTNTSQ